MNFGRRYFSGGLRCRNYGTTHRAVEFYERALNENPRPRVRLFLLRRSSNDLQDGLLPGAIGDTLLNRDLSAISLPGPSQRALKPRRSVRKQHHY